MQLYASKIYYFALITWHSCHSRQLSPHQNHELDDESRTAGYHCRRSSFLLLSDLLLRLVVLYSLECRPDSSKPECTSLICPSGNRHGPLYNLDQDAKNRNTDRIIYDGTKQRLCPQHGKVNKSQSQFWHSIINPFVSIICVFCLVCLPSPTGGPRRIRYSR